MEKNKNTRLTHALRIALILLATLATACGESAPVDMDPDAGEDAASTMDSGTEDAGDACTTGCGPVTCEDLRASGACPENRVCRPSVNGATCLLECEPGFMLNEGIGTCAPCENQNCEPSPTCEPNEPGSILASCTAQNRACEAPLFEDARCGACLPGFVFDMEMTTCVAECEDIPCEEPGAHRERQGDECVCEVRTCPLGSAEGPGGSCVACGGLVCEPDNHELAIHPRLGTDSECACKTALGYYWAADRTARPCDEDGDGWLSESAYEAYTSNDETIRSIAQAGCQLREVDRIVLENEYQQRLEIFVCQTGFDRNPACPTSTPSTLPMVESNRNDGDAHPDRENETEFPDHGRTFHAREVNSLTKGCVSAEADFDDDGRDDIAQAQTRSPLPTKYARWSEFAYFTELHTAAYEHEAGEPFGAYVISERSRCTFGQTMDDGAGNQVPVTNRLAVGMESAPEGYWSECARQRDAEYDRNAPSSGFDFAQWSCTATSGTCDVPPPPIMTPFGQGSMGQVPVTAHGLCDLVGMFSDEPEDFMGMHHHSQFKCVLVGGAMDPRPFVHAPATFQAGGSFELATCGATDEDDDNAPDFACAASAPIVSTVGFATARFEEVQSATDYFPTNPSDEGRVRGCIDEYYWGGVCSDESVAARAGRSHFIGSAEDYGRLLTCDPVTYVYAPELPMSVQPPERELYWDQGRWE